MGSGTGYPSPGTGVELARQSQESEPGRHPTAGPVPDHVLLPRGWGWAEPSVETYLAGGRS